MDLNNKRPKVLLLGNGINLDGGTAWEWNKVIKELSSKDCKEDISKSSNIPYSIRATIMTNKTDMERRKRYDDFFNVGKYDHHLKDYSILSELLKLEFDSILTTNYTYEIENFIFPAYSNIKSKTKYAVSSKGELDRKYLISTFNQLFDANAKQYNIWHIHGEVRNKSSIILTHEEYTRLLGKMVDYCKERANGYECFFKDFKVKSWIDYFIIADVYILGFSFDFSEFDLWWLLNRRARERAETGKIYFFDPIPQDCLKCSIQKSLSSMGVKVENCDMFIEDKKKDYRIFYQRACKRIASLMNEANKEN